MIVLIIILLFELFLVTKILRYFVLSPVYLYIIFSLASIVISVWYFEFYNPKFNLYHIDEVSKKEFYDIIKQYVLALVAFNLGIIIYYDLSKKRLKLLFNKSFNNSLFIKVNTGDKLNKIVGVLLLIILLLYVLVYGKSILIRNEYLPDVNRGLTVIIKMLSFVEAVLLGFNYKNNKRITLLFFLILMIISLGTGSRMVFLSMVTFMIIIFTTQEDTFKNKIFFIFNLFFSFLFLAYLIKLRGSSQHGVIPYLTNISYIKEHFSEGFFFNIYYSLVYGVYVSIKTVKEATPEWKHILIGINPLPGKFAGWYNYASKMRVNIFAPYSLHGRIFVMGKFFTFVYFFFTGIIFTYFEKKIRENLTKKNRIIAFIIVILLLLHIVYGFEYNFRAAFRYFYYAFFVIFIHYLIRIILKSIKK